MTRLTSAQFRDLFPALRSAVWLDTPGAPPGARPVVEAMQDVLAAWSSGRFDWLEWDAAAAEARVLFAGLTGVDPSTVSTVGSLAEAAATVAASLPPGRVVVPAEDFQSNLFPWSARHEVVAVPARGGTTRVEDLVEALDDRVRLLAVSEVTTREGQRLDLAALRAATDQVGARLFVNLTQSLGVLGFDAARVRPDYFAVHGYKWMLCPRGAAWLVTRPDRVDELRPLAPGWKSTNPPYRYFGYADLAADAARCDTSPAWFSWVGAKAALTLLASLDAGEVERHCLGLAAQLTDQAAAIGFRRGTDGAASHIVALQTGRSGQADRVAERLREYGVRALIRGDQVRFGFHYFNDEHDVAATMQALTASAGA